MLLEEFDKSPEAVITPQRTSRRVEGFPPLAISCFSAALFSRIVEALDAEHIADLNTMLGKEPVYAVTCRGQRFALYRSNVGAPACVTQYEEIMAMGSRFLILFGSCGVLDRSIDDCSIIIPDRALRDEGTSFHYAPAADDITVNHRHKEIFRSILDAAGINYVEGATWTTDACYRETREKVERRRAAGAICVEMECSAMQALCDFRGSGFFQFLYASDNLDSETWEPRSLSGKSRLTEKSRIADLAFELGAEIMKLTDMENV